MTPHCLALVAVMAMTPASPADTTAVRDRFLVGSAGIETFYVIGIAEDDGSISPVDRRTFSAPVPLVVVNAIVPLTEKQFENRSAGRISALVLTNTPSEPSR